MTRLVLQLAILRRKNMLPVRTVSRGGNVLVPVLSPVVGVEHTQFYSLQTAVSVGS